MRLILILLLQNAVVSLAAAQFNETATPVLPTEKLAVGQSVVVIADAKLSVGAKSVDEVGLGQVLQVMGRHEGLILVSRGRPGWLSDKAVVDLYSAEPIFAKRVTEQDDPIDYLARGNIRIATGKIEEGIVDLRTAVEKAKEKLPYHEALGYGLLTAHDPVAASASFDAALEIDAKSASALMGRGVANYQMGQNEIAQRDFLRAIELNPEHAFPRKYLASLYHDLGDLGQAAQQMRKAIELDGYDPYSRKAAGRLLFDMGRYDDAIEQFNRAIEYSPRDSESHAGLGTVLHAIGKDLPRAKQVFQTAIAFSSRTAEDAYLWNNLGHVQIELGEYDDALKNFSEAIELDPFLNEAKSHRAWLSLTQWPSDPSRLQLAQKDIEEVAKSSDPKTYWDYRAVAVMHDRAGERVKAVDARREALAVVEATAPKRFKQFAERELKESQ